MTFMDEFNMFWKKILILDFSRKFFLPLKFETYRFLVFFGNIILEPWPKGHSSATLMAGAVKFSGVKRVNFFPKMMKKKIWRFFDFFFLSCPKNVFTQLWWDKKIFWQPHPLRILFFVLGKFFGKKTGFDPITLKNQN